MTSYCEIIYLSYMHNPWRTRISIVILTGKCDINNILTYFFVKTWTYIQTMYMWGLGNATPGNVWVFLKFFEFLSLWKGISCSLRAVFSHSRFCRFSHFRFSRYAVNPTIHTGKYNSSIRIVRLSQEDNYDIIDEWFST